MSPLVRLECHLSGTWVLALVSLTKTWKNKRLQRAARKHDSNYSNFIARQQKYIAPMLVSFLINLFYTICWHFFICNCTIVPILCSSTAVGFSTRLGKGWSFLRFHSAMCILDFSFMSKLCNRFDLGTYLYCTSLQLGPNLVYWNADMGDFSVEIVYSELV